MSKNSLASSEDLKIAVGPAKVMSVRIVNGHIPTPLVLLALAEFGIAIVSVYLAIVARFFGLSGTLSTFEATVGPIWPRAILIAAVILVSLASMGLYQLRQRARFSGILVRLLIAMLFAEAGLGLIFYLAPSVFVGRGVIGLVGIIALLGLTLTRFVFLRIVDEDVLKRRVLVWGAGARAASIANRLRRRADRRGFHIVGYVRAPGDGTNVPDHLVLQSNESLLRLVTRHNVEEIVVAMDDRRRGFPTEELLECRFRGIHVCDILAFIEREAGRVNVALMQPSWLIFSSGFRFDWVRLATKRLFDVLVSIGVLVVTAPISLVTAIAIYMEDRGPILYRQIRVGQNGRLFQMLKFRSMRVDAEPNGEAVWAATNDSRVTRVGALIRLLRFDELPQVLNVLAGHMSFVGPRPERPQFVEQLTRSIPFYPERHSVKPGITGWAQVRCRYGSSERDAEEKLQYDLYYVKNHSLIIDLMVLLQTVEVVLFRIGSR